MLNQFESIKNGLRRLICYWFLPWIQGRQTPAYSPATKNFIAVFLTQLTDNAK